MGLSTHVLDTMHGTPAAGMEVALFTTEGTGEDARATLVRRFSLNSDGRSDGPLYDNNSLKTGTYRLVFDVAGYFKARGVSLPEPNFLNRVALDFGIAHTDQHYHVPLLVSPWSYSTYRGS
jgi:5-hydroxyisourate hydrolase